MTNPERSYFVREISRKIHEHINSVRRELKFLTEAGMVVTSGDDQKLFYQANGQYALFSELKALIFKAQVMEERELLAAIQGSGRLHLLVLSGFFVGLSDAQTDILIVGTVNRAKLNRLMRIFQEHFDRDVHYTIMSRAEFDYRNSITDRFLYTILSGPLITVIDKRKKTGS